MFLLQPRELGLELGVVFRRKIQRSSLPRRSTNRPYYGRTMRPEEGKGKRCRSLRNAALQQRFAFDSPWSMWQYFSVGQTNRRDRHAAVNHLTELERKHQALEREIQDALAHPSTNDLKLAEFKRKKLQLKDEIARLKGATSHTVH